ncbi:hypothetical protein PM082_004024 [Marasmius tenuissimus]|nr:hypothetical protein PM082_004024 [Marasmius tenuissimus]
MPRSATPSDAQNESRWATALDITQTVFTTVKDISDVIPTVPFLKEAAGLACGLLAVIDGMKQNKDGFKGLAGRAFEVIYVVHNSVEEHKDWSESMERNLKHLMETVEAIKASAESKIKKGALSRIWRLHGDRDEIVRFEKRLDQVLGLFNVVASIETYTNLRKIQRDWHEEMVRSQAIDLEPYVERTPDQLPSPRSESDESSIPETPSTNPFRRSDCQFKKQNQNNSSPPPPKFSMFDGASGIQIGGSISVNNVTGNQVNYSNSNNSSSNSMNSFNTTQNNVVNSGNFQSHISSPGWHSGTSGWSPSPAHLHQPPWGRQLSPVYQPHNWQSNLYYHS